MAAQLHPAARAAVNAADPVPGTHLVDVGCGTGNAAVLAAERGARVTGVDPAKRLLDVARARATAGGLTATFVTGEASAIPLPDGCADVVVSVFGVIFATDASGAAAEMARVAGASGRIVLCAWIPGGALSDVMRVRGQTLARARGATGGPPPFAWHDAGALQELLGSHGFSTETHEQEIAFSDDSPEAFLDADMRAHPLWVAARAVLEPRGEIGALRDRALEILAAANEQPGGFRVSGRYVLATATRASAP
jgi:SAM-dependent methyltransferase